MRQNDIKLSIRAWLLTGFTIVASTISMAQETTSIGESGADRTANSFLSLLLLPEDSLAEPMAFIEETWQPSYVAMSLDMLTLNRSAQVENWTMDLLRRKTGEEFGNDLGSWSHWMWNQPEEKYDYYAEFRSSMFRLIDPKFGGYFSVQRASDIRLDEVRWGGVMQDGIPPLRNPKMLNAADAGYLQDDNVIFGIEINGDARAYPKRILAWHEMFVDTVGGIQFAGVYCTLCGAVILYETNPNGVNFDMGTSGFLYRSNKLMYDQTTQSLWSTTRGEPVIGPLVGQGIRLQRSFVVTTTWGEWQRRHPDTTVLSTDTGHRRDYGEGVAYNNYFSTDQLMFDVPKIDTRLKNKDEVLALTFPEHGNEKLAIHAGFLAKKSVYHDQIDGLSLVVLTDRSGANRVYDSENVRFNQFDQDSRATDTDGTVWSMTEDSLTTSDGRKLPRLPAHRAFWFGWFAAHNDTRLVY